jgi:hypothetical protein
MQMEDKLTQGFRPCQIHPFDHAKPRLSGRVREARLRVTLGPLGYTRGLEAFDKLTALSWSRGLSKGKPSPLGRGVERFTGKSAGCPAL